MLHRRRNIVRVLSAVALAVISMVVLRQWNGAGQVRIPILLYHHFDENVASDSVISPETFEMHMKTLAEAGYTAVTFDQILAYVQDGEKLPEKPVCITMDDGYLSNYEIAWPILERYGMKATIFVIGCSVGHLENYKDTAWPITPHFTWEQAAEMMASGVIDIQCHTYDMHQWRPYETGTEIRENILPLEGETDEAYAAALTADIEMFQQEYAQALGREAYVLAYPGGEYCELSEEIARSNGFLITLSTESDQENIIKHPTPAGGAPLLGRVNITEDVTAEELLAIVSGGD